MIDRRTCSALALLLLAPALAARAADKEDAREPLPAGATIRLGASRSAIGLGSSLNGVHLLAPDFRTYLTGGGGASGPFINDILTGKTTDVPGFETAEPGKERPDGRTVFAVSADGKRAVTERATDAYLVFEVATGKPVRVVKVPGGVGVGAGHEVCQVALSADGKVLAFDAAGKGATREVIVWDVEKDVQLARVSVIQTRNVTPVLSPDGKMLATRGRSLAGAAAPDGVNPETALQVWDVSTGKLTATIPDAFPGFGAAVAFSPDGKTVATSSQSDGAVRLWDATTGKPGLVLLGRSQQGVVVAFSPDGKTLATLGRTGAIDRWVLPEGKPLKPTSFVPADLLRFWNGAWAQGLVFADNERVVAWGWVWPLRMALVWEAPGGKMPPPTAGHLGMIAGVRFTADGKGVITAGMDRRVLRWDTLTGRQTVVGTRLLNGRSWNTHLGPDGARGLEEGSIYDPATGEELFALPGSYAIPSADFRRAAAFHFAWEYKADSTWFAVWDLESRRRLAKLPPPATDLAGGATAAFSPDNSRLVTAVQIRQKAPEEPTPLIVTGWDVTTGKKLGEFRDLMPNLRLMEDVQMHIAAGDNSRAVVASTDGKLWVADFERGTRGQTLAELPQKRQRFVRPTFSPDRKMFAVGLPVENSHEFGARIYSWPSGKLLHTFTGHRGPVTALAFSPDGKTLASGSADSTVLLWDLTAFGMK